MAKPLERVQHFLDNFLYPLTVGGEMHVGAALDAEDLELLKLAFLPLEQRHLEAGSPLLPGLGDRDVLVQEVHAIEEACHRKVIGWWPEPITFCLGPRLLELAVAAHNLLFLSHPVGDGWRVGFSGMDRVEAFTADCIDASPPPSAGDVADLLNRHALLTELMQIRRTDIDLRFWAGSRTYLGMEPPSRLTAWSGLRRVRQERRLVPWLSTELSPTQKTLLNKLLRQSPLTDLLTPCRPYPPFRWAAIIPYLRSPGICRLVCNSYLEQGLEQVGPSLARAFWDLTRHEEGPDERRALRISAQLVVHLFSATCLTEDPTTRLAEIPAQARDPEASLGPILLAAAQCNLFPGEKMMGDDETRRRLEVWMDAWRSTLGQAAEELSSRLLGALY